MKKLNLSIILLLFAMAIQIISVRAQEGPGPGPGPKDRPNMPPAERLKKMIPDLTDEQLAKIKQISLEHKKTMMETRNLLREKEAHLETLQTKDNPNMSEINKTIDEIGALRTQMHKSSAQHRQDVRNLLTPAQKIAFDQIRPREMMKGKRGHDRRHGGEEPRD